MSEFCRLGPTSARSFHRSSGMAMEHPLIRGLLGIGFRLETGQQAQPGLWYRPPAAEGCAPSAPRNAIRLQLSAFSGRFGRLTYALFPNSGSRSEGSAPFSFQCGAFPREGSPDHKDHGDIKRIERRFRGLETTEENSSVRATSSRGRVARPSGTLSSARVRCPSVLEIDGNPGDFTFRREK